MTRARANLVVSMIVAVGAAAAACSSSTNSVDHAFGIACEETSTGGCRCFLSTTPNTLTCDVTTVSGSGADAGTQATCKKASQWPQPSTTVLGSSTAAYSATSPGCQCEPPGPLVAASISCFGQPTNGNLLANDTCSCNRSSPGTRATPCGIASGVRGVCCLAASGTGCRCSTFSTSACTAGEKAVSSCSASVFPLQQSTGSFASSVSSATDSCTDVPFDRDRALSGAMSTSSSTSSSSTSGSSSSSTTSASSSGRGEGR